jgi:spermidine synthase
VAGVAILCALFALSGAAGLLAEQVFEKLLSTLVGASTPASAVVLAVYFMGLTIGGLSYHRFGPRLRARRFAYPVLEVAVAAGCLALAEWFAALVPTFSPWLRAGVDKPLVLALLRGLVAALWILPLTIPMGATFPAITDTADRVAGRAVPRAITALYASNLAGAIVATVLGPLAIFPRIGMQGALVLAAGLDALAAVFALLILARTGAIDGRAQVHAATTSPPPVSKYLLMLAATTGFLLFALEVTWTHLASAVIGNSVYAFAAMLASVLIGLGAGSAFSAIVFGRRPHVPPWAPGGALLAGAAALAAIHPFWPSVPHAVASLGAQARTFVDAELARFEIAFCVLILPSAAFGLAYPLLFRVPSYPSEARGRVAGALSAVNAIGCAAGSLVTGFLLLPRLGSETTERVLVVLAAAVGAIAVAMTATGRVRGAATAGCAAIVATVVLLPKWDRVKLTSGEHVYFRPQYQVDSIKLLSFHEDTFGGITTVEQLTLGTDTARFLFTNGKFQGNDLGEMRAQAAFALAPMLYMSHFDRALVIGLGTGRSADVVRQMGFGSVDIAELAPGIVEAARTAFRHVNHGVLEAPNVTLLLEDGRNVLLLRAASYDLITLEITSVWFAGATNVYSREFYAVAKSRLREGGVLQQWVQLHHTGVTEIASVLLAARAEFRYVSLFYLGGQGIVVASDEPQVVGPGFGARVRAMGPAGLLGLGDPASATATLAASRLLAPEDVDRLASITSAVPNTDGNRFLEYASPRYNFRKDDLLAQNLRALAAIATFPAPQARGDVDPQTRAALASVSRQTYEATIGLPH